MRREVSLRKAIITPEIVLKHAVILLILLMFTLTPGITGAQSSDHSFGEISDSSQKNKLLERLLKEDQNGELRDGYGFPPIWDTPHQSDVIHGIIVMLEANPRINDIPINQGDYIGAFYTDDYGELKCGGADWWQDTANIIFPLYQDDSDTPEKDGFAFGETIHYKIFSWTTLKDYDVDVLEFETESPYVSNNKWYPLGLSMILDMQALVDMDFYIDAESNPLCIGNQLYLSAEEFIGTGGPYTFDWTSDPPGFYSNLQTPPPTQPDQTTTYFLIVSDGVLNSNAEVTVIVNNLPEANAGPDGTICGNETYQVDGTALYYDNSMWVTSGDGFFDDPTALSTFYTPGEQDNQAGSVTLTLIAHPLNPCVANAVDDLTLQVLPLPSVAPGEDFSVCSNDPINLNANAQYSGSINWTTSGDGTFSSPNSAVTQYFPGPDDLDEEEVTLTVCADAIAPCVATTCDEIHISFLDGPYCNAPSSRTKCENVPVPMAGSASNASGILWTTQGDGFFEDPSVMNTHYIAGPQDRANGGTVVTLNALPLAPCTTPATKNVNIILKPLPDVNAGNTNTVCKDSYLQLNASVQHANGAPQWETLGDGTFSSPTSLTAKYFPGTGDLETGWFDLILTAQPVYPCTLAVSDTLHVDVVDNPSVEITTPNNQNVCATPPFAVSADASFFGEINWETSGDGNFVNTQILNTHYIPGPQDVILNQPVMLTISVSPISPCEIPASSFIEVTFNPNPMANAGENQQICQTDVAQLSGAAQHFSELLWETGGDGTFDDVTIPDPVYTPGNADIISGSVVLTLNAFAQSPCVNTASDDMVLIIQKEPLVNVGNDVTICETSSYLLNGVVALNFSGLLWSTDGDGNFSNPNIKNPVYFPGANDKLNGMVELTLTLDPVSPCTVAKYDSKILTIINLPEANAGDDAVVCETDSYTLSGTAENYSSLLWETAGDGTFSDNGILNPVYTPGTQDIINGSVVLTLTAEAVSPCTINAGDEMTLTIQPGPFVQVGNDASICETGTYYCFGVTVENYAQLEWSTSGDGTFNNTGIKNPVYTPGPLDISNGSATLTLTAEAISPCTVGAADELTLTIIPLAVVDAGDDITACTELTLSGIAENFNSLLWTTSGDGSFSDPTIPDPVYTAGANDIENGSVTLTLTAQPFSPCSQETTDEMTCFINVPQIISDNVNDTELFAGNTLQFEFEAESYTSGEYVWIFNGETLEGQNTSSLIIENLAPENAGYYQCTFTNECGTIESGEALVTIFDNSIDNLTLPQGWSGVSSYIMPGEPGMEDVFSGIVNDLVIIANNDGFYWPEQNINTLGEWSVTSGYKIKMAQTVQLEMDGYVRYPSQELIIPPGWSYLPVNAVCAFDVEELFGNLSEIGMIKDIAQTGVYWPGFGINTLQSLYPRKAYQILNTSDEPVAFTYPVCGTPGFDQKDAPVDVTNPWNTVVRTPSTHVFGLQPQVLSALETGDIIGIFTSGGYCAGALEVVQRDNAVVLVAFADDPTSEAKDGFDAGEAVSFRVFRPATDEEFIMDVTYSAQTTGQGEFIPNGISMIEKAVLKSTATGIHDISGNAIDLSIYPNPTTGKVNLLLQNGDLNKGSVSVININGQTVFETSFDDLNNSDALSIDLSGLVKGVYYLKVTSDDFIRIEKIVLR